MSEIHLEVSKLCNMNCIYCFAHQNDISNPLMPLIIACRYIEIVLKNTCSKYIEIVFHGGEPLLHSTVWFYNVIEYAIRLSSIYDKTVSFTMQSNCTLLDDEKLNLIKEYNIIVGTSLDGPSYINDLSRKKSEIVLKNIQKLKEIKCFGGVICVINKYNYDKMNEVMKFFEEEDISASAVVSYSVGSGKSLTPLNSEMIFLANKGIFDYLEETNGKGIIEGNMASKLYRYINPLSLKDFKEILICSHPFCGGGITTIMCDTEGNLYPCGCCICDHRTVIGNLNYISDDVFIQRIKKFHEKDYKYFKQCAKCDASRICLFGCPAFSFIDIDTTESECMANKQFYQFLKQKDHFVVRNIVNNLEISKYGNNSKRKDYR